MATVTKYRNGVPNWVDVAVDDIDAAVAYYTQLFGWNAEDQGEYAGRYHMFDLGGKSVAGLGPKQNPDGMPIWSTYLAVDDLDATLAAVEPAGGTITMPRMEIPEAGVMGAAKDPSGAVVAFWQEAGHIGCELVNEVGSVGWNELTTRDAPAAMDFYRAVTGCDFAPMEEGEPDGYQLMQVGGRTVGGVMPMAGDEWGDLPSHWMTYFVVADADETASRSRDGGGAVSVEPFDTPVGKIAVLNDPTGCAFSVIAFAGEPDPIEGGVA